MTHPLLFMIFTEINVQTVIKEKKEVFQIYLMTTHTTFVTI